MGIDTEPKLKFTKKHIINTNINTMKEVLYVKVLDNYFKGLKKKGL